MEQKANMLNWITAKTWGLNFTNTKFIYEAAIEPAILYAVQVWKEALDNIHMKKNITSIQRKFAIKINKAYNTAPTSALQIMGDLLPIHLRAKYLIWKWHLTTTNQQIDHHFPEDEEIYTELKRNNSIIDLNNKNYGIDRNLKKNEYTTHPAEESNYCIHWEEKADTEIKTTWKIYTDGSRSDKGTGASFIIKNSKDRTVYQCYFKLGSHCTNSQAELYAILKAINHVENNIDIFKGNIYIMTDSKTSLHRLINRNRITILSRKVQEAAKLLSSKRKITFAWVKGHSGNDGNDMADKLAKLGASSDIIPSYNDVSLTTLKNYLLSLINTIWQREWETAETGRNCFQFIPSVNIRKKANYYKPNKFTTQVILGHGNFPAYLHRFSIKDNNLCDCNNSDIGDAIHFAFHCEKYSNQRSELFYNYLLKNPSWPPKPVNIYTDKNLWKIFEDFIIKTEALKEHFNNSENRHYPDDSDNMVEHSSEDEFLQRGSS
ncbi:uncharacterized protein LOC111634917 [Centruroides sculpturatus]|uniref:uncharacterized protein LOC111634917 n=1 Tax=Centruroides sculpturatus TaxID=218467 RepID=UPI000C6EEF50|nr:uncharacterized protein LOC111634917 [Centruroides sculpturatus]